MGEGEKQILQQPPLSNITVYDNLAEKKVSWAIMGGDDSSSTSSLGNSSTCSNRSSTSSSDLVDDATSSSTSSSSSSSSSQSNGPLFELSDLMAQLPIKRGLSKYFHGKSQSYTSLSKVRSIEDLVKKETPYQRKMKACKSYGGGLDTYKSYTLPKPVISKKVVPRGSFSPLLSPSSKRGSFLSTNRLPPIHVQRDF